MDLFNLIESWSAKGLVNLGLIPPPEQVFDKTTTRMPKWVCEHSDRKEYLLSLRSEHFLKELEHLPGFHTNPLILEDFLIRTEFSFDSGVGLIEPVANPARDVDWVRICSVAEILAQDPWDAPELFVYLPFQKQLVQIQIQTQLWDRLQQLKSRSWLPQGAVALPEKVGTHLRRRETLLETLQVQLDRGGKPLQVFFHSRTGSYSITESDLDNSKQLLSESGLKLFVHSIYTINLADDSNSWVGTLEQDLINLNRIGGRGVVVHVGKSKKMKPDQGLKVMHRRLASVLEFATDECPLLLETPAGAGTELCVGLQAFCEFVEVYSDDPRLKVCIDTAHVFAAGEDPLEYLQKFTQRFPDKLALIHFNDSCSKGGSCVDHHAGIGEGYIGSNCLKQIAQLAEQNHWPCIKEW